MADREGGSEFGHKAKRLKTEARTVSEPVSLEKAVCNYIKRWQRAKGQGMTLAHLNGPEFEHPLKPKRKGCQRKLEKELIEMPSLVMYEYEGETAFKLKEDEEDEEEMDPFEEAFGLLETVSAVMHEKRDEMHPNSVKKHIVVRSDEWDDILDAIDKAQTLFHRSKQQQSSRSH